MKGTVIGVLQPLPQVYRCGSWLWHWAGTPWDPFGPRHFEGWSPWLCCLDFRWFQGYSTPLICSLAVWQLRRFALILTLPGLGTFTDLWWTRAVNSSQELRNGSQRKSDHLDPRFRCTKLLGHILLTFPNSLKVWQKLRRSMVALACSVLAKKTSTMSTMRSKKT